MITLDNISFEFGGRFLYKDASLQIKEGDRLGLIGRNGTGKTTLLRIITGGYSLTSGTVSMPKNTKIGFLNQDLLEYKTDKTVFGVAMEAFEYELGLKDEIELILDRMETDHSPELLNELTRTQHEFEALDGYNLDYKARNILAGLGFLDSAQDQVYTEMSGGWRMRVMLAKILLQEPDILLLDEPTNHLDLPSIQWLESYLNTFKGAFVIVSHDRFFLDRLAKNIVEIDRGQFIRYKGNYTFFLTEKEERRELQQREFDNQQKTIAEAERFINRFRAKASKAKQAQSKIKQLDKLERFESPADEAPVVSFRFQPKTTPGKQIAEIHVKSKRFGDKLIFENTKGVIMRGDKIALIGANGLGKSTLMRMVAAREPFDGTNVPGHNVEPSFFAQHQLDALDAKNTILEEMGKFVMQKGETFVRSVLGGFLFSGDDVNKKISVLSGGEKSRVALAKTLLSDANFLMLDEPTNHLDIQSIEILIQALQQYEGTYIVVSHDRFFLERVANKVWDIEDHRIREFPGTYEEYEYSRSQKKNEEIGGGKGKKQKEKDKGSGKEKEQGNKRNTQGNNKGGGSAGPNSNLIPIKETEKPKLSYEEEKKLKNRLRKLQSDVEGLEKSIMELEAEKESLIIQMADPEMARNFNMLLELQAKADQTNAKIEKETLEWESALEELEAFGDFEG